MTTDAARAKTPRGGLRTNLTVAVVSVVVFAAILEASGAIVLQLSGWDSSLGLRSGQAHLVYDALRVWKLRPSFASDVIHVNAEGFRGPHVDPNKAPGTFRVIALGDSITFGTYDCERHYCADQESYPAQLARLLASSDTTRPYEVLNAGTEGYNSTKDWRWFRDQFALYHPDLVLVMTGWNDVLESRMTSVAARRRGLFEGSSVLRDADEWLRRYSHAYRVLWYGVQAFRGETVAVNDVGREEGSEPTSDLTVDPDTIREYGANLRRIVRAAHATGAAVALFTLADALGQDAAIPADMRDRVRRYYGWTDLARLAQEVRSYNDNVRAVAASEGAQVVDFASMVEGAGGWRLYALPDINHPTHDAMRSLTVGLADDLRAAGLVPRSRP